MKIIVKRTIASIIVCIVLIALCGAEIIGALGIGIIIALAVIIWKVCKVSSAFPEDNDA